MLILLCFSVVLGWAGLQQIKPSETCLFRPGVARLLLGHGLYCSCCRGNNRSWYLGVWGPAMVFPLGQRITEPAQYEAGLWLGCYPHSLMFLYPVGQEGKCPTATVPVPQLAKKSVCWVASVLVGQPDCSPGFWVNFNLRGNVWNTAFALKRM